MDIWISWLRYLEGLTVLSNPVLLSWWGLESPSNELRKSWPNSIIEKVLEGKEGILKRWTFELFLDTGRCRCCLILHLHLVSLEWFYALLGGSVRS